MDEGDQRRANGRRGSYHRWFCWELFIYPPRWDPGLSQDLVNRQATTILFYVSSLILCIIGNQFCGTFRPPITWHSSSSSFPMQTDRVVEKSHAIRKGYIFLRWSCISIQESKKLHKHCKSWSWFWDACRMALFVISYGKGPCDGVEGTVKRLAARASVQRPYENHIQTSLQLFEWVTDNIKGVHFAMLQARK